MLMLCAIITILVSIGIVTVLAIDTVLFFRQVSIIEFFTETQWTPLFYHKHYGILPLLMGTFVTTLIAVLLAVPVGLSIAIYLSEYAPPLVTRILKPVLEILSSIPTVVYGFFALIVVSPLGVMIIPYVTSLSEDALRSVPKSLRESSYALGATRFQTSFKILLPAASSGIMVSIILAISRAMGETMIVAIAAGQEPRMSLNPLNAMETITTYIVQVSMGDIPQNSIEYKSIFAAGMTLFIFTFLLNNISYWVKRKFELKYE
jgi:phosphate transport system permease protein